MERKDFSKRKKNDVITNPVKLTDGCTGRDTKLPVDFKRVVVSKGTRKLLIDIGCILYFYCDGDKVKIITDDNSTYGVAHTLTFWQKRLARENFFRCHKGYLINMEKVTEIIPYFNATFILKIKENKNSIPVGRKFIKDFKHLVSW